MPQPVRSTRFCLASYSASLVSFLSAAPCAQWLSGVDSPGWGEVVIRAGGGAGNQAGILHANENKTQVDSHPALKIIREEGIRANTLAEITRYRDGAVNGGIALRCYGGKCLFAE